MELVFEKNKNSSDKWFKSQRVRSLSFTIVLVINDGAKWIPCQPPLSVQTERYCSATSTWGLRNYRHALELCTFPRISLHLSPVSVSPTIPLFLCPAFLWNSLSLSGLPGQPPSAGAGLRSVWLQQRLRVAWVDSFTTSPVTADSETGTRSLPLSHTLYTGNWHKWGSYNFLSDEVGKPALIRIWQKDLWCVAVECRNLIFPKKVTLWWWIVHWFGKVKSRRCNYLQMFKRISQLLKSVRSPYLYQQLTNDLLTLNIKH